MSDPIRPLLDLPARSGPSPPARRRRARALAFALLVAVAGPACRAPAPEPRATTQPERVSPRAAGRVPGAVWQRYVDPAAAGFDPAALAAARRHAAGIGSAAVFIVHDGAVLDAWGAIERRLDGYSVRKSLLGALIGIEVDRGTIDLEASLAELDIDDRPYPLTARERSARVVDLLRSRSGIYLPAAYETEQMRRSRPPRGRDRPGVVWHYNNWDFNALGTIYERAAGEDLFVAFARRIAEPLAMQDYRPRDGHHHLEAAVSRHPAYPFRMSARDLARFGLLTLRGGRWGRRQVVPGWWVAASTRAHSVTPWGDGYGLLWWIGRLDTPDRPEVVSALGVGGHAIDIIPTHDLVVVHRAEPERGLSVSRAARRRLLEMIVAAHRGPADPGARLEPLPENPRIEPAPWPASRLARLAGTYDDGVEPVRVRIAASGPLIETGHGTLDLVPLDETALLAPDAGLVWLFEDAPGGSATLRRAGAPETTATRRR